MKWIRKIITYRVHKGLLQKEAAVLLGSNRDEIYSWEVLLKKAGMWPKVRENKLPIVPEAGAPRPDFIRAYEHGPSVHPEVY